MGRSPITFTPNLSIEVVPVVAYFGNLQFTKTAELYMGREYAYLGGEYVPLADSTEHLLESLVFIDLDIGSICKILESGEFLN